MMGAEDRDEDAGAGRGRKLKNSNDPSAPWSEHSHILGSGTPSSSRGALR